MTLGEFCIRRPVFTTLLMAAMLVGGIAGYQTLAVSALPNVDFPTISVSASLPGASAETMAATVAAPLERQFSTIAGISAITSTSYLGSSQVTLQFDLDRSIDGAALDVQSAIAAATSKLPREMLSPPSARKVNPADQPVLYIAVSSDTLPLNQVNEFADTLMAQRISIISGVAQVSIFGAQKYAVRIAMDPQKLAAQNLSMSDLRSAIGDAASHTPMGTLNGTQQQYNLDITGQPQDAAGFRRLIARWRNGAPVRVGDLGTVSDSVEDIRSISFFNGKQAIVLAVQRQPDANTIAVVDAVRALLPQFRAQIPAAVTVTPLFDRSVAIRQSVRDVEMTLLVTIGLVVAVIYGFLHNARATLIPALAVPISIVATYGVMALLGFSINNVSLLALTLCVGFVVDDAIVVLENIVRHMEEGMTPFAAAIKGASEIGFTIISITFSLVAVFIPVLFMGGLVGRLFSEFAVTISVAILISGLVSLTLTPMLASKLLRHAGEAAPSRLFQRVHAAYARTLDIALAHPKRMLALTALTLLLSIAGFVLMPKGFFPTEDNGFIFATTEAAQDISYDAMLAKQKRMATIVAADPAVGDVFYAVGGSRALNNGRIFFGLKPRGERPDIQRVMARLRKAAAAVEGMQIYMQPIQSIQVGGRQSKSLYQYTLQGNDLDALYAWSDKLFDALKHIPGVIDAATDLQTKSLQATIEVDADKAASLGVSFADIREALYAAYGDQQVAALYRPANDYAVIMTVTPQAQSSPQEVGNLYVRASGNGGQTVPLSAFSTISRGIAPLMVNHQGQLPAVTLSFNLAPGSALSTVTEALHKAQQRLGVPDTIIGSFQGSAQVFQDSARGQGGLVLLSILVIYIILGMLYESYVHPVTILSGLPSAGIGALLALWLLGMDLNIIALVGIILLIGIVKKNAIMMIDFAISARAAGAAPLEAIRQACLLRFRPIMMTTMAAIFGTLPIALALGAGAELRQPLGIAVTGGLLFSQLLTLYITPVVYLALERLRGPRSPRDVAV